MHFNLNMFNIPCLHFIHCWEIKTKQKNQWEKYENWKSHKLKKEQYHCKTQQHVTDSITVEPCLTANSAVRHFFWPPSKNDHTFSCKETLVNMVTSLKQPNFFGPLVAVLTGFHCTSLRSQWIESLRDKDCWIFVHTIWLHPPFFSIQLPQCGHCIKKTTAIHEKWWLSRAYRTGHGHCSTYTRA